MGDIVRATKPEMMSADATVTANSRKSWPVISIIKARGTKTATAEIVAEITAKAISSIPRRAASMGSTPASTQRVTFSKTTMASSTTKPIASVIPINVNVLIE